MDPIPIENWPCAPCGRVRAEHVVGIEHPHTLSDEDRERLTETAMISLTRYSTRLREGKHDPPLSPPAERRRIREAAGFSQQQIADQLHVNRHTVGRGEKPAGHLLGGRRLPGREPVGEQRKAYARLLENMREMAHRR